MIIKILDKPFGSLRNILDYNEKDKGIDGDENIYSELISTNCFGDTYEERLREMSRIVPQMGDESIRKNPIFHIPIRLAKGESLTNVEFEEVGLKYMDEMGFSPDKHPYQMVRHYDVEDGEHIHLVLSRYDYEGNFYDDRHYKKKSNIIRRKLEKEYGLVQADRNKLHKDDLSLNEINAIKYGNKHTEKNDLKNKLNSIVESIGTSGNKIRIDDFVLKLRENNIHPMFNLQNDGEKISGISFHTASQGNESIYKGSQVGFQWNNISHLIDVIPEDKHFLVNANADTLSTFAENHNKNVNNTLIMKNFVNILNTTKCSPLVVESISKMKVDKKISNAVGQFLNTYPSSNIDPIILAHDIVDLKLAKQEYALFYWEDKHSLKNKKDQDHFKLFNFLKENYASNEALGWIFRHPNPVESITLNDHLAAYNSIERLKSAPAILASQESDKLLILQSIQLDPSDKAIFMNTPFSTKGIKDLIKATKHKDNDSFFEVFNRETYEYKSLVKVKLANLCTRLGSSPINANQLYNKFNLELAKNGYDYKFLGKAFYVANNTNVNELLNKDISQSFRSIHKSTYLDTRPNLIIGLINSVFSTNSANQETRDVIEIEQNRTKKRKKRRLPPPPPN
jgi:hypothetical protein